jgi:hypothetical protein
VDGSGKRSVWNSYLCVFHPHGHGNQLHGWLVLQVHADCHHAANSQDVSITTSRFTLRKGCLNPAIAFSFQLFAAVQKGNALLLVYSLFLIVGAFIGGLLAVYFFWNFYAPLRDGLALQKMRTSDDSERFEDSSQEG